MAILKSINGNLRYYPSKVGILPFLEVHFTTTREQTLLKLHGGSLFIDVSFGGGVVLVYIG